MRLDPIRVFAIALVASYGAIPQVANAAAPAEVSTTQEFYHNAPPAAVSTFSETSADPSFFNRLNAPNGYTEAAASLAAGTLWSQSYYGSMGNGRGSAQTGQSMKINFDIITDTVGYVPIYISYAYALNAAASNQGRAVSRTTFYGSWGLNDFQSIDTGVAGYLPSIAEDVYLLQQIYSGVPQQVVLSAQSYATNGARAYAYIDPTFTIDPSYLALHPGAKLVFSAGFSNGVAGAVPEPATWAMMLIGFGMIGAAARYRRRKTALTYA